MRKTLFLALLAGLTLAGCKSKEEKKNDPVASSNTTENTTPTGDSDAFDVDVTTLKDEAGFLKAWEDFTTARIADEKRKETDKNYQGHYLEYLKLYTRLLKATTAYSKTIQPASAAVAFSEKVNAIENKMYPAKNNP